MEFGIFDHVDRPHGWLGLGRFYEERLRLIESYDRLGFRAYHLAEHHFTPLGMVPSPAVFLAAIAQRTRTLRFGPFVYALPFHHPLRMVEEICMVDQLSGGRLELGFGRGSSPIEMEYYGLDPETAQEAYAEALDLVVKGLTRTTIGFAGAAGRVAEIPMELDCVQKPHPPIWYGAHSLESAERAAGKGLNIVTNDSPAHAAAVIARFRQEWRALHGAAPSPRVGLVRFILVGENDAEAEAVARRAYRRWQESFNHLWRKHGRTPRLGVRSTEFDELRDGEEKGVAGAPATVAAYLQAHLDRTGADYLVGQFAFGDLALAETTRSVELFARHVMPVLRDGSPAARARGMASG